jgi:integrase
MFKFKRADIKDGKVWICQDRKGKDFIKAELDQSILEIIVRQPVELDGLVFHKYTPRQTVKIPKRVSKGHGFTPGTPLDKRWLEETIKNRAELAGLLHIKPHDLRHAAATWARQSGCSPWLVQALLGHSTVSTTEIYASKNSGDKRVTLAILEMRNKALKELQT